VGTGGRGVARAREDPGHGRAEDLIGGHSGGRLSRRGVLACRSGAGFSGAVGGGRRTGTRGGGAVSAGRSNWLKGAWDTIWGAIKAGWNTIHNWLSTWWSDEVFWLEEYRDRRRGLAQGSLGTIKGDVTSAFNGIKSVVTGIWNDIVSAVKTAVNTIKGLISDITGPISSIAHGVGSVLGHIGLASGGVIPGYAPGHDSVPTMLSPGEGVLVPEAVRALGGAAAIDRINQLYSRGRTGGDSSGFLC
jgi:hypothetical protein